jgi:very-short-patch-repair endonuclease
LCGWKSRRQAVIGRYIVDFCCPDAWFVVELDGGGHTRDRTAAHDAARTKKIEAAGYLLIRFWNREVTDNLDGICETIVAQIKARP